jgi:hypothetical protein
VQQIPRHIFTDLLRCVEGNLERARQRKNCFERIVALTQKREIKMYANEYVKNLGEAMFEEVVRYLSSIVVESAGAENEGARIMLLHPPMEDLDNPQGPAMGYQAKEQARLAEIEESVWKDGRKGEKSCGSITNRLPLRQEELFTPLSMSTVTHSEKVHNCIAARDLSVEVIDGLLDDEPARMIRTIVHRVVHDDSVTVRVVDEQECEVDIARSHVIVLSTGLYP